MFFTKLIGLYFLLLNFQCFASFTAQTEPQGDCRRVVPHFTLPYSNFPDVLQAATGGPRDIPLPRSAQRILKTFDPTPVVELQRKNSTLIFFKPADCPDPDSDFSFVVKKTPTGENAELNSIELYLQDIGYPLSHPSLPHFVMAEFTLELVNGKHFTVYPAAKGIRLFDMLTASIQSTVEDDLPLFLNLGRALFHMHDRFRPTREELDLTVTDSLTINIHRLYSDMMAKKPNDRCVSLACYDFKKTLYFFARCHGDLSPTNVILDGKQVELIDFSTLERDLPSRNGFSSIANDVTYFVACTRVCFRGCYTTRDAKYLNTVMGGFLAGYLEEVPIAYREDMFSLIRESFEWFIEGVMMPPLSSSPTPADQKIHKAAQVRYKNKEIETILAIAAQLLHSHDADTRKK